MSDTSVVKINYGYVLESYDNKFIEMGRDYLLKERFLLGKGTDIAKAMELKRLKALLDFSKCELDIDKRTILEQLKKLTY